jgi:signal-transduction protein with cAMP-binding, CBS, and nucleotidyltransferase domain
LTIRDIVTGLEPSLVKLDPDLTVLMGNFLGPNLKEHSQRLVSEVMSPIKATVDGNAPIFKPLYLMIQENVGLMPVIQAGKVAGMIRFSDLFNEIAHIVLGDQA